MSKYNTWFFKRWMKFLTWFGDRYFATALPKVNEAQIKQAFLYLQPGDIIQRKYIYYLDSYFIKGAYSHSSFCFAKPVLGISCLTDDVAEGNRILGLVDFIKDCDGFRILRPRLTENQAQQIWNRAIQFVGARIPYDGYFDTDNRDAMYCHEYVARIVCGENQETDFVDLQGKEFQMLIPSKVIYAEWFEQFCDVIYVSS